MGTPSASGGARELYMRMVLHESTKGGQQHQVNTTLGLARMRELVRYASAAMDAFDEFESQLPPVAPSKTKTPVPNEQSALSKGMGEVVVHMSAVELKFCDMMIDKVAKQLKSSFPITDAERDAQLALLPRLQKKVKFAISKL